MDQISFRLNPLPPFDLRFTAWALRRRSDDIIDRWDDQCYRRVIVYDEQPVEVEVTQTGSTDKPVLYITATSGTVGPGLKSTLTRALERMLGFGLIFQSFMTSLRETRSFTNYPGASLV